MILALAIACTPAASEAISPDRFADDLRDHLVGWYDMHADDVAAADGNALAEAQAAVDVALVRAVTGEEDPFGYDPSVHAVFSHPDVVWPGSDTVWFGAYAREDGALVEIVEFN